MASKKTPKRNEGLGTWGITAITSWREARHQQGGIIRQAISDARQTEAYLQWEFEKKLAFARMAFTVAIPAIVIALIMMVLFVATW